MTPDGGPGVHPPGAGAAMGAHSTDVTVVIATHNRRQRLLDIVARLEALPERPPVVVVDNASNDGTPAAIRSRHPGVRVIECRDQAGSAARTLGVEAADTPLIAFNDDDSWWEPGALRRATELFRRFPGLGLIAARIVVEPGERLDPTCADMRASPFGDGALPGPAVLGFLACGAIARRSAILGCGGFHPRYGFGGEEHLLALDLATAGWGLAYVDDVVVHHEPVSGERSWRGTRELRNKLWSTWLRRPLPRAARLTFSIVAGRRGPGVRALLAALRGLPWVARERRVVPSRVEHALRLLEGDRVADR